MFGPTCGRRYGEYGPTRQVRFAPLSVVQCGRCEADKRTFVQALDASRYSLMTFIFPMRLALGSFPSPVG